MFGWGIAQAGHNFIIGNADDMLGLIPAVLLGHMGKHGPVLLVGRDAVPQAVRDYLEMVRPDVPSPNETVLNFAWIIGDPRRVSWEVQQEITRLLSPSSRFAAASGVLPRNAADTTATAGEEVSDESER